MIISVFLYKDGVEMHKYNDRGNYVDADNPDVQRFMFPKERIEEVKEVLSKFHMVHPKLDIYTYTECCSLYELDDRNVNPHPMPTKPTR